MRRMVLRATASKLTRALVVISPASTTRLFLTSVSAATRERGSWARIASSTASEIWSATLSGCPSDTDSEVNRNSLMRPCPLGRPQGYQTLASIPHLGPAAERAIAARAAARRGNRPRLDDLWDLAQLPQAAARQSGAGRLSRRAHAAPGHRLRRADARRAAGDVVPPAPGGDRAGSRGERR